MLHEKVQNPKDKHQHRSLRQKGRAPPREDTYQFWQCLYRRPGRRLTFGHQMRAATLHEIERTLLNGSR